MVSFELRQCFETKHDNGKEDDEHGDESNQSGGYRALGILHQEPDLLVSQERVIPRVHFNNITKFNYWKSNFSSPLISNRYNSNRIESNIKISTDLPLQLIFRQRLLFLLDESFFLLVPLLHFFSQFVELYLLHEDVERNVHRSSQPPATLNDTSSSSESRFIVDRSNLILSINEILFRADINYLIIIIMIIIIIIIIKGGDIT